MKKWLKVLLAADFFLLLSMGMIIPIYAIFVEKIGGDVLAASGAWAVFTFTSGILIWLFGLWGDKVKHLEKMIFFGYLIRSFAFLGYFFVSNQYHLFFVQTVLGVGVAASLPAYDGLYSRMLSKGKFASEWGTWEGMNLIVAAIAAIIGGTIAKYLGFKTLFIIMFVSGLIGALISLFLMSKKAQKEIKSK
ncbi:MFS transporter [Candidatus Woesearchaeota archaeon]|nr:MFS transporter [Candidatus Woesearchaeota archaeon]